MHGTVKEIEHKVASNQIQVLEKVNKIPATFVNVTDVSRKW